MALPRKSPVPMVQPSPIIATWRCERRLCRPASRLAMSSGSLCCGIAVDGSWSCASALMALHRGEVISRTELYEHLFDENEDSLSNLVDVHVFSLRKKLGHEFIVTRRGHGYSIEG